MRLGVTVITLAFKGARSPPSLHSGGDVSGYVPLRYGSPIPRHLIIITVCIRGGMIFQHFLRSEGISVTPIGGASARGSFQFYTIPEGTSGGTRPSNI